MSDRRGHTSRQIYVRNHLYAIFEELANESGNPIDYLINESMRYYAKNELGLNVIDPMQTPGRSVPPPLPTFSRPHEVVGGRLLYLWFNGERHVVDKARFVIGRGGVNQSCDLVIPDSNISRRHCAITYHSGDYLISDLDSTNGVEYMGKKVKQQKITEGDQFYLCDYPIIFTYLTEQVYH